MQYVGFDRTMQDIVFTLVPGLRISEVAREKKFYETFGKKEPEDKEDEDTKKNEEIRKDDNDYHRNDEQVKICLECCNSQLSQLRKKYIRISSQATVMHVKKFLAKKLRIELNKLDLLCNEEILEKDNTLKSVSLTNWRDRDFPIMLHYRASTGCT